MAKKKGFIARYIEGPDITEEQARAMLPGNRWELGWDIFKTNFTKLVLLNLLVLLFCLVSVFVIISIPAYVQINAGLYPFSQNIAVGYPSFTQNVGLAEKINLQSGIIAFALVPLSLLVAIGLSGGMYVMRNLVCSEGVFVKGDFWTGVKKNYKQYAGAGLIYSFFMCACYMSLNFANAYIAANEVSWFMSISKVVTIISMIFGTIMFMYQLSFAVTYKMKFFRLIKNSFFMAIALLPQNLFFLAFALLPILLLLINSQIISGLVLGIIIMFGASYIFLVWSNYSQWVFDKFVNDKVPGARKNRGIYQKENKEGYSYKKSKLKSKHVKPITDEEITIVELPETFSRADLVRLEESKEAMRQDSDDYRKYGQSRPKADDKGKKEDKEGNAATDAGEDENKGKNNG